MNKNIKLAEVNVAHAKHVYPEGKYIDNDLILFEDIAKVPLPSSSSRMKSLFLALCTSGKARYTVDTKQHEVSEGDVIIISEGQVVGDYLLSPDCKGIALFMSCQLFSFLHVLILFSILMHNKAKIYRTILHTSNRR